MKTTLDETTLNRRTWLKKSLLTAGGVIGGTLMAPSLLARPALGMKPYQGNYLVEEYFQPLDKTIKARLNANENVWGPSKMAIAAIAESAAKGNRYVYSSSIKMMELLGQKEGVSAEQILMAAGSTDLLEKTAFALCMKGGNVVSADPSYMSLVKTATAIGATWKNVPLKADYSHDLDAMEKAIDSQTKLVYICNPNNPTGTLTPIDAIKSFCKRVSAKVPVFIDEAYLELLESHEKQTAVGLIAEGYDVMVCRTFSKIHGMAGLRMGYMVAKAERVKAIQSLVRTEMGICVTSLEGAMASLKDEDFQKFSREQTKIGREYTFAELKKAGFNPIPSVTNFILFPIEMPTKVLLEKMTEQEISMRGFDIGGKPYGRVSIGTMDEMKLFSKAIKTIMS
jgi:histidinol-phosphate aminotransferase